MSHSGATLLLTLAVVSVEGYARVYIEFIGVVVLLAVLALLFGYVNVKARLVENGDLER